MSLRSICKTGASQLVILAVAAATCIAQTSAQDTDIKVDPVIHQFASTALNTDSAVKVFTITNRNIIGVRSIDVPSLSGPEADQFIIHADTCANTTLAANGGTCTISVKYHPTHTGSKSATLRIPSSDMETPILSAFVTTTEASANQAKRRLPPVVSAVNIPETMNSGQQYTLTWSLLGYDTDYQSEIVFFDCSGISNGTCGDSYLSNVTASGNLTPAGTAAGDWTYQGVTATRKDFSYTFTAPSVAVATEYVIRFYSNSQGDSNAGKSALSLLVPGNLSGQYYDTAGRRISKQIIP